MFLRISGLRPSICACALRTPRVSTLGLDGHVVGKRRRVHHRRRKARLEHAHEVVFERQVEPRLARVALAAGASAQLVVDASRLVALGAEHVEPAGGEHLVVLGSDVLLRLREDLVPLALVLLGVLVRVEPALSHLLDGAELGVSAEHDVGATASHVGGDGHGALAAGLGDNGRLLLVLLGVEDVVADAVLAQFLGLSVSDFSTDTVPTRTGWPLALRSRMSSMIASNLACLRLVEEVGLVGADHRHVGGDGEHAHAVGAR